MMNKKNIKLNNKDDVLSPESRIRQTSLDQINVLLNNVHEKYGPILSKELESRINSIIRHYDIEMKKMLRVSFEKHWENQGEKSSNLKISSDSQKDDEIPKFIKDFNKKKIN